MKKLFTLFVLIAHTSFGQLQGNALNFTSTSDVVVATVPTLIGNLATTDVTIDYWVNLDAVGSTGRTFYAQFNATNFVSTLINGSGQLYFYVSVNGTTYSQSTSGSLPTNQWIHVAHVWNSTSTTVENYFNGVLQTGTSGGGSSGSTDGMLSLGAKADGSQSMSGTLDEFRIWSVDKAPCEISLLGSSLYSAGTPNLVTCYHLDEGTAGGNNAGVTTANAIAGNNGTLNGFALSGSNSNWVTSGATITSTGLTNTIQATDVQTACGSLVWIDGNTYTSNNNTATFTVTGSAACDTTYTLDLTILQPSTGTDVQQACDSFTWMDGVTYTSNNNSATFVVPNAVGCDSTITLDLTILQSTTGTDVQSACETFTWLDGITYTSSNNSATFVVQNAAGCDSTITLDLTISTVDVSVTNNSPSLTANATTGTFQWIDCDNGNTPIAGANAATFVPTVNGNYAVIVTQNGCADTSACQLVDNVGLNTMDQQHFVVYPNPNTTGMLTVKFAGTLEEVRVWDAVGREVSEELHINENELNLQKLQNGWYSFEFKTSHGIYYRSISVIK